MKKVMWILSLIPLIITSVILQFMPEKIPMHHDVAGNVDRWGNRVESLIFPILILVITLFWFLMIRFYEKKLLSVKSEKEQMQAKSAAKFLGIVGIAETVMFGIMHFFILYSSWKQAVTGAENAPVDISKISCILMGILFVVLGNFMPKAKKNSSAGVRTTWSMYNDNTWRKSNRFGAIAIIAAGILTVVTAALVSGITATILMLVYIMIAAIVAVVYSKKVYDLEKSLKVE